MDQKNRRLPFRGMFPRKKWKLICLICLTVVRDVLESGREFKGKNCHRYTEKESSENPVKQKTVQVNKYTHEPLCSSAIKKIYIADILECKQEILI